MAAPLNPLQRYEQITRDRLEAEKLGPPLSENDVVVREQHQIIHDLSLALLAPAYMKILARLDPDLRPKIGEEWLVKRFETFDVLERESVRAASFLSLMIVFLNNIPATDREASFVIRHRRTLHVLRDSTHAPIIWEAYHNHSDAVKALCQGGDDVHAQDDLALILAVDLGFPETVRELLGEDSAARSFTFSYLPDIISRAAFPRFADPYARGGRALLIAAERGNRDVLSIVVPRAKWDRRLLDRAITIAIKKGFAEAVVILSSQLPELERFDGNALVFATQKEFVDVVREMLEFLKNRSQEKWVEDQGFLIAAVKEAIHLGNASLLTLFVATSRVSKEEVHDYARDLGKPLLDGFTPVFA